MKNVTTTISSQEFVSPIQSVVTGKAPGLKVKLLSTNGETKNYVLVFSPGDEASSGLYEFAQKYDVKCAHYTAIGDILSAKIGFFDYERKMFKVIPIDKAEVTSFIGNITSFKEKPVVHTHVTLAVDDGSVKGGHLLELIVGPTLEVFLFAEPTALYKKLDHEYNFEVIDPFL